MQYYNPIQYIIGDNVALIIAAFIAGMLFMYVADFLLESILYMREKNATAKYIKKVRRAYKRQNYLSQKEEN